MHPYFCADLFLNGVCECSKSYRGHQGGWGWNSLNTGLHSAPDLLQPRKKRHWTRTYLTSTATSCWRLQRRQWDSTESCRAKRHEATVTVIELTKIGKKEIQEITGRAVRQGKRVTEGLPDLHPWRCSERSWGLASDIHSNLNVSPSLSTGLV